MVTHFRASDPAVRRIMACRWHFTSRSACTAAAEEIAQSEGASVQLFTDAESPALLVAAFGKDDAGGRERLTLPAAPARAEVKWTADAEVVARWDAGRADPAGCLVVVRQPLVRPERSGQRDWIATVLRALNGDESPPPGLLTASFFATRDGAAVLNLAEWTSAAAHREALRRGSYGRHGSIGSSPLWRATREHPAITPEHEVHRYLAWPASSAIAA